MTASELTIRAAAQEDLEHFWTVLSKEDGDLITCRPRKCRSAEEAQTFFSSMLQDPLICVFTVLFQNGLAGRITFFDYNCKNNSMELGYSLLPDYRGRNIMYTALCRLIPYLFQHTGLNKIYAQTGDFNKSSIRLLERLGFQQDGCLRQHHKVGNVLYNDLIYSLLKDDLL